MPKYSHFTFATMLFAMVLAAGSFLVLKAPLADEEQDEDRTAAVMEEYHLKATGEVKRCIRPRSIRRTKVLDDFHILFEIRGKKLLLNTLRGKCPTLKAEDRFSYTVRAGSLCSGDIIEVIPMTGFGPMCGLGDFAFVERVPEEESSE